MKVLFVSPYFAPDYASSSPMYAAMAEDLARAGHQVTVITGMPYFGRERIWEEYRGRFLVREAMSGYRVIRVYTSVPRRTSVFARLISWELFDFLAFAVGLAIERHDVLFIPSPFLGAWLCVHLLSRLKRMRVIYSVEDIYPDVAVRQKRINSGWQARVVEWFESGCYRRPWRIRVLSEGMRQVLISKRVPANKIVTLPFFADTDFVRPLPRNNSFRERYGLDDKFIVLYAGNLGLSHGLESVLKAAQLLQQNPEILFVLVGEGGAKPALEENARQLGLRNLRFLPFQPREEVPSVLSSADLSLVTLKSGVENECVPSKVYWILASGRPLVASVGKDSEIARLTEEARCGICVDPDHPESLAAAILQLKNDPQRRHEMGQQGREFVVEHYSRQSVAIQFNNLIESACAPT